MRVKYDQPWSTRDATFSRYDSGGHIPLVGFWRRAIRSWLWRNLLSSSQFLSYDLDHYCVPQGRRSIEWNVLLRLDPPGTWHRRTWLIEERIEERHLSALVLCGSELFLELAEQSQHRDDPNAWLSVKVLKIASTLRYMKCPRLQ